MNSRYVADFLDPIKDSDTSISERFNIVNREVRAVWGWSPNYLSQMAKTEDVYLDKSQQNQKAE